MGTFKQEIEAIIKSILPTDLASNKIDKRLFTASWDMIVGSGPGVYVKKTIAEVWTYITGMFVGEYTKQQSAVPVVFTGVPSPVLDALIHQDVQIDSPGAPIVIPAPLNPKLGYQMLISSLSATTITWNAVFKASENAELPTLGDSKRWYCNFRYNGTNWILLGTTREV